MLTRLSFLDDTVAPSEYEQISRRISPTLSRSYPGSRCLMNQAFSRARVASSITRMPSRRQKSQVASMFSIDIGWPPAMFTLVSLETYGMRSAPYCVDHGLASLARSKLPLNGWSAVGVVGLVDDHVDEPPPGVLLVEPGGGEVHVPGDHVARAR